MSTSPPCARVIAVTGGTGIEPSPYLVAAATAAGATGIVDMGTGEAWTLRLLRQAASRSAEPIGVRVGAGCAATLTEVLAATGGRLAVVVLTADAPWPVAGLDATVLVEVADLAEARAAVEAGAHGLIARGMESAGRVSDLSTFVLLQHLREALPDTLVWAAGGIGPRTAAAVAAAGAAGVVLDSQLLLMPESDMPDQSRATLMRMDGTRPDLPGVGADGPLAAAFAARWADTGAAIRGIRAALDEDFAAAAGLLAPGGPLAAALGVELPVAQGPMTRVSDEPAFAAAVADAGGLPFIALALADVPKTEQMLAGTAEALGDRPWGVGILGFAPDHVKAGQIEVIRRVRPAYAIIAGGRPAQAKALEAEGIRSFLHVPSPGLLKQFLAAGSRRFVFEGAECGGHVGPRASFPLWEAQLAVLDTFLDEHPAAGAELQIFFAGGVHDARSAAMVAALAAPLARRGAQVGVLMGTAYLFTSEAVSSGAIQPLFQRSAVLSEKTALLETAPGHATRCLATGFADDFHALRDGLEAAGVDHRQVWEQLEMLNVGRLRVASKGLRREGSSLVPVDEAGQAAEGLFMAGQVAVLRSSVTTISALHSSVTSGARDLLRSLAAVPISEMSDTSVPLDIAIIGMACIFPGSSDLAGYWRTILGAADEITEIPRDRWDIDHYYAPEVGPGQAGRVTVSKWGGFIDPIPFDAIRYGIPPSALASIDPTQLLALEVSQRALTDAGYPYDRPGADHARTGVVFGAEAGGDLAGAKTLRAVLPGYLGELPAGLDEQLPAITEDSFPGVLANVIAGRIANRLDLGGPNFTVDAACASSLAALDAACKELATGGSDLMICGGADLHNGINDYLMFTSAHALSPTGRCRTFDSTGDGIALGEGVATVVLKRLADAERDGDRVYAVIKGLGGASDGRALGLTAPRAEGQRRALDRAYRVAGISPREVGLVEAHGTGTVVGDRTELETLTRLFTDSGAEPGQTTLGSVKSQIGHTKCAAGLAGVIKAALALHVGVKPPTINLTRPNPAWSPSQSPFSFQTSAQPWAAGPRFAGVSAFGFGGTNYHAVLAAHAPDADPRHGQAAWPAELFCFRGSDRAAAQRGVRRLLDRLQVVAGLREPATTWAGSGLGEPPSARAGQGEPASARAGLRALATTWAGETDPRVGPVRIAVVARDLGELSDLLDRALAGEHEPRRGLIQPAETDDPGRVAFLFPGQGSQRPGALAELFITFPELRHYLDLGRDWADVLFPPAAFDDETADDQKARLRDTRNAQPALGLGGLAVDHLLRRLGIRPDLTAGHSYGELVALCVSGAFDPATLLDLSRSRAASILAAAGDDPGTMAAVSATPAQIAEILGDSSVVVANHNAPAQAVISGATSAVAAATAALTAAGLTARPIPVACAFHSPVVAGGSSLFADVLAAREITAPAGEVWSNRTAFKYPNTPDGVRAELAAQIASPVRFVDQIEAMYAAGARVFVEAGPGQVLTGLVGAVLGDRPHLAVPVDGRDGLRSLLLAVAQLACAGVPVNTGPLFRGRETTTGETSRPLWTVDGHLVRDPNGACLPGGLAPARRIPEELIMTTPPQQAPNTQNALLSEYLRTTREMITSQRDVMLAFLGHQPATTWEPAPAPEYQEELVPAMAMPAIEAAYAAPAPAAMMAPAAPAMDVQGAVLTVISERTGYPIELIELDLDLEADLSVDSIKRAEVAGEVASRLGLSADGDESELEDLVKARTVRSMVDWLDSRIGAAAPLTETAASQAGLGAARITVAPGQADMAGAAVDVQGAVLAVISDRTGYPVELIEPDLDLEADLSVDSIKRAEVAGEVITRLGLSADGDEAELEDLVKARTVRAMVEWLESRIGGGPAAPPTAAQAPPESDGIAPQRLVSRLQPAAAGEGEVRLNGARFLISGGSVPSQLLADLLGAAGARLVTGGDADGLILLDGLDDGPALLPDLFGQIRQSLAGGVRWVLAAGRPGERNDGMPGLFRTIAREYPEVTARYVEFRADTDIPAALLRELGELAVAPVVAYTPDGRHGEKLEPDRLGVLADGGAGPAGDGVSEAQALGLDQDSVLVLVGGARGITPWFARTVAAAARCRVELIGRTPLPSASGGGLPAGLASGSDVPAGLASGGELPAGLDKAGLRAELARRGMRSPAEIDRAASAILAAREVEATIADLTALGATVNYHCADVRDEQALGRLIAKIHDEHGRIDGVVYAAGIIDDKLIADKEPESFARVFGTKVDGCRTLLHALGSFASEIKFVVLFGSIAAAYGNRGQSDYAAANDALDTLGARWASAHDRRLITVHWGPWGGRAGMVTPELIQEYARRGIALIDPEEGALSLLRELAWGTPDTTSVVYTASGW
ncbi:acyl transferase domain-containing protein/NAD(P)H-dependent flavin oxidoreductase YrpB (nitropropane dioxygenase family)/acyl carrier protein [Actinoplanes tereljensis]|uniref:Polyketide synthase n=1 Tax=Paractinoplanes tereljensis TaxID=571912 RepID=A0A919TZD8_9ACTN|nr:type I polyketide synthase [Actinoplanes tereljensis]GIF26165.1 polyketide synthase [Actinoplanes tereljensis]